MRLPAFLQPVRRRLPLLICALLLAVVTAFSWAAFLRFEDALLGAGGERVGGASRRLAAALEESTRRGRAEWKLSAAEASVETYLRSRGLKDGAAAGQVIQRRLTAGSQPMALQLRRADGEVLLSVGTLPATTGEPRRTPVVADSVPRGGFVGPFAASGDTIYYEVVIPVTAARGDTVGYLAQYRRLSASGPAGQLIRGLVGADATVVLGNVRGGVWTDLSGLAPAPAPRLELGRPVAVTGRGGEPALGVATEIKGTPWLTVVALPRRELLAPARELLGTTMWLALIVLAVGALGAWALSRQITGPLAEMTLAAKGIAGGDYSQRVTAKEGADELGQLAASFNSMASQVDAATHELEHQMEQLQDQATELEHQSEEAQALAEQLEASNEELSRALAEAEEAREALGAERLFLRQVIDALPNFVFVKDRAGRFTLVNQAVADAYGTTVENLVGKTDADFNANAAEVEAFRRDDLAVMDSREARVFPEDIVTDASGTKRWLQTVKRPLATGDGPVDQILGVSIDLTEHRKLEAQLRQSQKMEAVGQLAGGVAHDFNNLLTVIKGHTEFALEGLGKSHAEATDLTTDLTTVREAADRAAALTRQLLAFSRQQILEPQVLDLNDLVANFEKMVRRVIPADIAIVANLAADLGTIEADPGQLEQVLMNLVVNARDAMPDGGTVTIETANVELDPAFPAPHAPTEIRPGPYVALMVSDTGSGMDEVIKSRIFEPFFTTKERGSGTGLGLATVYGIVKQSGGYVWVYSELGEGTTFRIYLPRTASGNVQAHRPAEQPAVPRGAETILLVEDEPLVRGLASRVLAKNGYRVLTAANGAEALGVSAESTSPIDLVVSDLVMPELGGRELAEQLRTRHPGLRVLFMSGYTEDAALRRNVLRPGESFLPKPFTPDALARKVREVLDGRTEAATAPDDAYRPPPGNSRTRRSSGN